jgi:tRNA threonylcarbamoyladenosine modification (KEOPS) complex  Pcc1 subunit
MALAATYGFTIDQGATFSQTLTWKDPSNVAIDLTGYTARMQIRGKRTSTSVTLSLTTENGGITLGDDAGTIDLLISATDSAAMEVGTYVYDLELISVSGSVSRLLMGNFVVRGEVTR